MDLNSVRRVSSAGYRLPEPNNGPGPAARPPATEKGRRAEQESASTEQNPDRTDPVKQDRLWTELVWGERRAVREWEKNWGFLKNYDQMGQMKPEKASPSYAPLFSDRLPNTTNQMFGSRLSTPLGCELVRLDRLILWSASNHKRKLDPEMLPC